jgi:hypothetical protein
VQRDRLWEELERTVDDVPGADRVLLEVARQLRDGRASYERTHWGRQGRNGASLVELPDVSGGLVQLGELSGIMYRARKGRSGHDDWFHEFDRPFPRLCYSRGGSDLVVVRSSSRYRVTTHGIVG